MDLTNLRTLTDLLKQHHLYTQKNFGQNFLVNRSVIDSSINAAQIHPTDTVVEIGVGAGTLTRELAQQAHKVLAFEIDTQLKPLLQETIGQFSNIKLYFQDIRQADVGHILAQELSENSSSLRNPNPNLSLPPYKVVANLPYNAGTHILGQLVQLSHPPQSITVLLQKEVAEKIVAVPPHATYLSNFIQSYGKAHIVTLVKPGSFFPAPKVHSAVLHIAQHPPSGTHYTTQQFSRFLHRGFANPRKKINKAFSQQQLQLASIDSNLRPENLAFSQWTTLFDIIQNEESR